MAHIAQMYAWLGQLKDALPGQVDYGPYSPNVCLAGTAERCPAWTSRLVAQVT